MLIELFRNRVASGRGIVRRESGVTLTELVIVASIVTLFAASSLPFLGSIIPDLKTRGASEQVVEALRTARQNAIGTTATYRVIFTPTSIQTVCTNGTPSGNVCPLNRPPDTLETVVGSATLAALPTEMQFDPKGSAATGNGCVDITYSGAPPWRVRVNIPGRVVAAEGTCS
jgi:Tfp pilus assembly protein FimT